MDDFFNQLDCRRVVFTPGEMVGTLAFSGSQLEALGIVMRLVPYVITGPMRFEILHRLAGVSKRKFQCHWDDVRLFLKESDAAPGHWELAQTDAVKVQIVSTGRRPLRHFLRPLIAFWGAACVYCGRCDSELEVEHIVPKARGGSDDISNLTVACPPCNIKKFTKTAAEFGFPEIHERAKGLA